MTLHLLYPGNPLRHNEPDELYAEEHAAALESGFQASLFPFEEFLASDFRLRGLGNFLLSRRLADCASVGDGAQAEPFEGGGFGT